jgi:hypothetical protein
LSARENLICDLKIHSEHTQLLCRQVGQVRAQTQDLPSQFRELFRKISHDDDAQTLRAKRLFQRFERDSTVLEFLQRDRYRGRALFVWCDGTHFRECCLSGVCQDCEYNCENQLASRVCRFARSDIRLAQLCRIKRLNPRGERERILRSCHGEQVDCKKPKDKTKTTKSKTEVVNI